MDLSFERYHLTRIFKYEKLIAYCKVEQWGEAYRGTVYRYLHFKDDVDKEKLDPTGNVYCLDKYYPSPEECLAAVEAEAIRLMSNGWKHPWEEPCPKCRTLVQTKDPFDKRRHDRIRNCDWWQKRKEEGVGSDKP